MTKNRAKFLVPPLYGGGGTPAVSAKLNGQHKLVNINTSLLMRLVGRWKRRTNAVAEENDFMYGNPTLVAAISIGQVYEGTVPLLQCTKASPDFSWWEKILIRRAFKFRRADLNNEYDENDALSKLAAQATSAIKDDLPHDFETIYKQLRDTHKTMISVSETSDNAGNPSNLAGEELGWTSYARQWTEHYRPIFAAATDVLDKNTTYFRDVCYFARHLCSYIVGNTRSYVSLSDIISMQAILDECLDDWWKIARDKRADVAPNELNAYDANIHKNALENLISGWGSVLEYSLSSKADKIDDWGEYKALFLGFEEHLAGSIENTARAVISKNKVAADIWVKHLLRWPKNSRPIRFDGLDLHQLTASQHIICDTTLLDLDWQKAKEKFIAHGDSSFIEGEITPKMLFEAIKLNMWRDGCMVLAGFLLDWAKQDTDKETENLSKSTLYTLINLNSSGDYSDHSRVLRRAEIFYSSFLRIYKNNYVGSNIYTRRLTKIADRIEDLVRSPQISGRVYSLRGNNLESIRVSMLHLVLAHRPVTWSPHGLEQLMEDDSNATETLQPILEQCVEQLDGANHKKIRDILNVSKDTANESKIYENFKETVTALRDTISEFRTEEIRSADINKSAINEIEKSVTENVFTKSKAGFPFSHFADLELIKTEKELSPFRLSCAGFPKTAVINNSSEEFPFELHYEAVQECLVARLMVDVLQEARQQNQLSVQEFKNTDDLARQIIEIARTMEEAVIVAEFQGSQKILFDWRRRKEQGEENAPVKISRTDKYQDNRQYLFDISSIPAFRVDADLGGLLMFPQAMLAKLTLRKFENDCPVQINFEQDKNDPWNGTINYHWERKVELSDDDLQIVQFVKAK